MFFEKRRFSIEFNFQIKDFFLDEIPTNPCSSWGFVLPIIPYQVITGNYNPKLSTLLLWLIIPYQVITGNYNLCQCLILIMNYTIPSDNRELQPVIVRATQNVIIPYQVITGNYNLWKMAKIPLSLYHTK